MTTLLNDPSGDRSRFGERSKTPSKNLTGTLTKSLVLGAVLSVAMASHSWAVGQQSFRVRFGVFQPDGESAYWFDKELDFFGDIEEFEDTAVGIDYVAELNPLMSLLVSADYYYGEVPQSYRDYEGPGGSSIVHDTSLSITPLTVGLAFNLTPRRSPFRVFVGAGGGIYLWRLEEIGDFIDFDIVPPEIFFDRFKDEGEEFGYYLLAGLEVPVGRSLSFVADARFDQVETTLGGDFRGFGKLDLSGSRYTFGIGWRL
ncbi:MAG: outer membrane beta-barrel protein [Thermoanaerobaculia bacterium]|nr:outer membrane beta-barrel protein [Thermoanaerobaculia bacterium]